MDTALRAHGSSSRLMLLVGKNSRQHSPSIDFHQWMTRAFQQS
jgi:hypothetical protein